MMKDLSSFSKKIYDSVHGFIRYDDIENELIDSIVFQRLHYIHQMGVAYVVYPGATHSRFEHSLGVLELATRMFERICENVSAELFDLIPRAGSTEYAYWKKILRLAALCHDLGHLPFSHVAEEQVLGGKGHEHWTIEIIQSSFLKPVFAKLQNQFSFDSVLSKRNMAEDVLKIAIGDEKLAKLLPNHKIAFSEWERILSRIIPADFFGADRIDYLLRDSKLTGVVYGFFDYLQLIESLRVLPNENGSFELGIDESGLEACEALLLARYFMYKRVYFHPSIKAYTFHMRRCMKEFPAFDTVKDSVERFVDINDCHVVTFLMEAAKNSSHKIHEDAKKILYRHNRFKAIPLDGTIQEKDLINFKEKYRLKDEQISWEFKEGELSKRDVSFPVSRRYGKILSAKNISPILSHIMTLSFGYVYIAPEFEQIFLQAIKK